MNLWNLDIPQRPFLITSYGSNNSASLGVAKPLTIRSEPTCYVVDLSLADFGLLGFSAGLGDPSPSRSTETRVDRTRAFTRRESTPLPELWSLEPWGGRVWDLASRFRVLKTHNYPATPERLEVRVQVPDHHLHFLLFWTGCEVLRTLGPTQRL